MLAQHVWTAGAVVVGGYLLLFVLARRAATLRPQRVGWQLAILAALRLIVAAVGVALEGPLETTGLVLVGALALGLILARRVCLVRASAQELRGQVETACRGLFLVVSEPVPGRWQRTNGEQAILHMRRLAPRVQLMIRCVAKPSGKVALLYSWLAKQNPGPAPRLRIVLKGGDS